MMNTIAVTLLHCSLFTSVQKVTTAPRSDCSYDSLSIFNSGTAAICTSHSRAAYRA